MKFANYDGRAVVELPAATVAASRRTGTGDG